MVWKLFVAWCILAPFAAIGIGFALQRLRRQQTVPVANPRALMFEYLLDGVPTGELVPQGRDPGEAAASRSFAEGKRYTARRI